MCVRRHVVASVPDPDVLVGLQQFWEMFLRNRSLCGSMPESAVGHRSFHPGAFYRSTTPYESIVFKEPVTLQTLGDHNEIAAWNNENFVIRLWAILESNGFTKPIRDDAKAAAYVKLLKRLRQHFGHGSGIYDDSKREHRALRRETLRLFPDVGEPEGIPLSIDTVLRPMWNRAYEYAQDVLASVASPV